MSAFVNNLKEKFSNFNAKVKSFIEEKDDSGKRKNRTSILLIGVFSFFVLTVIILLCVKGSANSLEKHPQDITSVTEEVSFDDKYFHMDNEENMKNSDLNGYSIYLLWADEGCMDYDYTRQAVVPVTKTHGEQTADKNSYFYVNTEVKEDDKEYITNCEYYYWESMRDSEPDITTYSDIEGCEYVSFQLHFLSYLT